MLVAISIPIFNSQLEKSREATDAANLRNAYAECSAAVIEADSAGGYSKEVTTVQTDGGFTTTGTTEIGGVVLTNDSVLKADTCIKGAKIFVNVGADGSVTFTKDTGSFTVIS